MADDIERLILEMSTDLKRFEKGLDRATSVGEKRLSQIERRFEKSGQNMARSMGGAATNINRAIAGIAVGAAIREVQQYADAWTAAKNKLAAAGVPMDQVNGKQRELVALANETRSSLESTVDLYAKLTRATEALGANQTQVARATETVNKGFKAGGAAASEQASGILQLGQALSSGLLQGDELRSLRENAPLIAQAIAAEFQTTVGGLKVLGAEGKLTADRVFGAILAGSAAIDAQFARTTPTIADSFTILRNEATQFVGELDRATGASAALAAFIIHVSDNLDILVAAAVIAASVLGGVLAGQAVVALIAGLTKAAVGAGLTSASFSAMGVRATLAAGGVNALKAALAFFGGPIGLAVTGVAIAFGLLTANAAAARLEAQQMTDALDQQAAAAGLSADTTTTLAEEIAATQTWAAGLTGQTHLLADAHYRAAAGAKAQAIEEARLRLAAANETLGENRNRLNDRVRNERLRPLADIGRNPATGLALLATGAYGAGGGAEGRAARSQEYADLRRSTAIVVAETRNLRDLMGARLEDPRFQPPTFRNTAPPATGGKGKDKGDSAEEAARKARAAADQLASIAAANAIQIAQFRRDTDALAVLERQEMLRERINALMGAGLSEAAATTAATEDQAAYDAARAESIARVVAERQAEVDLAVATTNEDVEQVRTLTAKAELAAAVRRYQEDGLSLAEAETKALADHVRLEEARIEARVRFMAEAGKDHRQRLLDLQGETAAAERLARAREVENRSRRYRDEGGMSAGEADARARSEVVAETRAAAQGAFRDAFRNGVLEAVRSGDLVAAAGEFALNASQILTDKVLNAGADALFDILSKQFPNLFDLGQELLADTTAATTMSTAITTSGAAAAGAMGTGIATAGATAGGILSASLSAGAVPAAAIIGTAIATAGAQAAAAMAAAIGAAQGGGQAATAIATAFAGARASGGPVRYHMRNEKGPEPFVPTSAGVIFSNQAMRGLASLGNMASQGGGMGGDVNVEVVNATGVPATVKQERTSNGGTKITLEPMFEKGLEGAGRSGALKRAARMSPSPTKRG